jgi:methionyl-tRNA formyltransferase
MAAGESLPGTAQRESLATAAPEPSGELLRVDFGWPTERVLRRVRALSPVPGVALSIRGVELFVTRASVAPAYPAALAPGEAHAATGGVVIRTADGAIRIDRASIIDPDGDAVEQDATELSVLVAEAR